MRDLLILAVHLLVMVAKFLRLGGARAVAAESLLLKHQLIVGSRARRRAPNLTSLDRFILGLSSLFVSPHRIAKFAGVTPAHRAGAPLPVPAKLASYRWKQYCRGLFQIPTLAGSPIRP